MEAIDAVVGFLNGVSGDLVGFASSVFVRGALLLVLAFAATGLLHRAAAAYRHHAWALAMAGLVALPLLAGALPRWRLAVPAAEDVAVLAAVAGLASGDRGPADPRTRSAAGAAAVPGSPHAEAVVASAVVDGAVGSAEIVTPTGRARTARSIAWLPALLLGWAVGFLVLFGRLLIGLARAARLARRARPVTERRWNVLVSLLSLRAGLDTSVRLVCSSEVTVPMAWGLSGSWLVLPEGIESWPEDRRRVVVLHELAHLRRRDCLVQALAGIALAVHWLNPLAWLAAGRLRSERERACDDAVLAAGVRGPAYAHHLVEIARGLSRPGRPARAAVAMARPSELENRVLAILDDRRNRSGLGRRAAGVGLVSLAALLVPVAAVQPSPAAPAEEVGSPATVSDAGAPVATAAAAAGELVAEEAEPLASGAAADVRRSRADDELGTAADAPATPRTLSAAAGADTDVATRQGAGVLGEPPAAVAEDTIEERVFRALARALESDDAGIRRRVAHTLGMMESPRGVEPLGRLIRSDPDAGVRAQAAWGLGMIESAEGVDALAAGVRDSDAGVRKQAAWALGMIESAEGVDVLVSLLEDADPKIRKQAAWALGMIESSAAVESLTAAFAAEEAPEVRAEIIWALGMIEDREAAETIVDALEDPDPGVRDQALWALGMVMN